MELILLVFQLNKDISWYLDGSSEHVAHVCNMSNHLILKPWRVHTWVTMARQNLASQRMQNSRLLSANQVRRGSSIGFFKIYYAPCPRSLDTFYIGSYYLNWVKTSWTYSIWFFKHREKVYEEYIARGFLYYMIAPFTMHRYVVNQACRCLEGISLHRQSRQIPEKKIGKDLLTSYVRNMF